MKSFLPSAYELKKMLLWPRTQVMRWRYRNAQPSMKAMMEIHYYRPEFFRFVAATFVNKNLLHPPELNAESTVIDIGAFTGSWAQQVSGLYDSTIYSFEPNPKSFARLMERAQNNPKLKPVPYGLGDRDEEVDFVLSGLGSTELWDHSEFEPDAPRIRVEIADVKRVWEEFAWPRIDLVKINIEGAEYSLLERMIELGLHESVGGFLIQFHEWHPRAYQRRRAITKALEKTHRLEWCFDFVWEKWVKL